MEFNEKLQQLRNSKGLTQEQLAEKIYVSRTAISKWESGRGYPSIDSLKVIAKFFSVTIDELLSSDELVTLAENDKRDDEAKLCNLIFAIFDIITLLYIFLPFYGQPDGDVIRSVSLLSYNDGTAINRVIYFITLIATCIYGIIELIIPYFENEKWIVKGQVVSLLLHGISILFFVMSRQPYVASFMFCFFAIKIVFVIRQSKMLNK